MLSRIEISGYRCLQSVDVSLGPVHLMIGPNGSGKSTLLDAVAFVADVVRAGPEAAVYGDDRLGIEPRVSDALDLLTKREGNTLAFALTADLPGHVQMTLPSDLTRLRYELEVRIDPDDKPTIAYEVLWLQPSTPVERPPILTFPFARPRAEVVHRQAPRNRGWRRVLSKTEAGNDSFHAETTHYTHPFRLGPDRSALGSVPQDEKNFPAATWFRGLVLDRAQRLALNGAKMRLPAPPGRFDGLLPDGSNLANAVEALLASHPDRCGEWLDDVRLVVDDLESLTTIQRPEDRRRYLRATHRSGVVAPSYTMSDGTLRLLALTILPYLDELPALLLLEEPENGIHPLGLEPVYSALSTLPHTQVLCATHSPMLVNQAEASDILVFGKTKDGVADVVGGQDHPALRRWMNSVDRGTLFADGVLSK